MTTPDRITPYQALGGEVALRRLVARFYELMDTLPEARAIRAMHPADLSSSQEKLFMFLSGWLGGPPLFEQAYGHPRLRARHLPFEIDRAAAEAWMACMRQALMELEVEDEGLRRQVEEALEGLADHMRNRPG